MRRTISDLLAIDLFAGAGGLSLGFEEAGFKVIFAVENDIYSKETYKQNRKEKSTEVIVSNISKINYIEIMKKYGLKKGEIDILLCGPPCQGFSTANTRTRSMNNLNNHLFKEFLRAVREIYPKWILFENVSGIVEFEKGNVIQIINTELSKYGYFYNSAVINSVNYGVPQKRKRFFLIGNRTGVNYLFPEPIYGAKNKPYLTVRDAIYDLPFLENGNRVDYLPYRFNGIRLSEYQKEMREKWDKNYCNNNLTTKNSELVIERYKFIPEGGNWQNIPNHLMKNYNNKNNCHSGIYKRLLWNEPSVVISNFRKNMLIHPKQHRGLSVREAARLQTFPDWYLFYGSLESQQQQVANAVPPWVAHILAFSIKEMI